MASVRDSAVIAPWARPPSCCCCATACGERAKGRRFEQQAQVQLQAELFAQTRDHLRGGDGVTAEQEEVIVGATCLTCNCSHQIWPIRLCSSEPDSLLPALSLTAEGNSA